MTERAFTEPGFPLLALLAQERLSAGQPPLAAAQDLRRITEKLVLDNFSPASVLVNEKLEILYFVGNTDAYLTPPTGEARFSITKMARESLKFKLSTALHLAQKDRRVVQERDIRLKTHAGDRIVDISVRPVDDPKVRPGLLLVVFEDRTPSELPTTTALKAADELDPRVRNLEHELYSTKEHLQTTIEELETSNEELKSTNEELQSVNEELQSTNEELETSKEELQSTNEELVTVNAELSKKVEELSQANNDMNNLLASTEIGTIFLDGALNIKRYTPKMTEIFNLIPADLGRSIGDITARVHYGAISADAKQVLDTLVRQERIVESGDKNYHMRIMPYRTSENVIDGVVITFVEQTLK